VIDLGEISRESAWPGPEAIGWRAAGRRSLPQRVGAAATTLVSVAVLLTGAAAPAGPPLAEARIGAGLGDTVRVMGDQVYVVSPDLSIPRRLPRMIASHELPDGRLLWQTPLVIRGTVRAAVPVPGATLMSIDRLGGVETVAIEESTGRVRWRRPYLLVDTVLDRNMALAVGSAPATATLPAGRTLSALDLTTGKTRWQYRIPEGTWNYLDQQWVVNALPSGRVEVHELADGRLIHAADLRAPAPPSVQSWVQPVRGLLVAATGDSTVVAYGLPGLDRRWQAGWDLTDWSVAPDCGNALCVFSRTDGLRSVDPATGRTRWSDPRWISAESAGGRLLVRGRQRPGSGSVAALLDPATGRELLDLGHWTAVGRPGTSGGALLAGQIDARRGQVWFGAVDPRSLTVRVLDSASGLGTDCQPAPDSLVCRRRDSSVSVWRLARPEARL
jgi:outer membrane protein assembly factor BamB